jgi:hypothetical protein
LQLKVGTRKVVGKVEVKIRLQRPLVVQHVEKIEEKKLVIDQHFEEVAPELKPQTKPTPASPKQPSSSPKSAKPLVANLEEVEDHNR